ncbi:hypothetical protein R3W88_015415 [Solanum pinnatisectum]|uniref:Uncharacterized protein n=1 Tax=Solanum pinnatisectum TaxID=50273 RepID=A0AAV9KVK9_9SOLN|nr:hypothetical protein R3W88_015415 [Solanum pinnatisectum]
MEVTKVLHMNGGIGNSSYAKNSLLQQKVILMTKSITNKAISALYNNLSPGETIRIADLGCSSGPNTFLTISQLIQTIHEECKSNGQQQSPEIHVFLNDLPSNDFNTIFRSLPTFYEDLRKQNTGGDGLFVTGIAGSFYTRLFPSKTLHFRSIEEEKVYTFNIPAYYPSVREVMYIVDKEGSFTIDILKTSFTEPLLVSHFGDNEILMDQAFHKCREIYVNS